MLIWHQLAMAMPLLLAQHGEEGGHGAGPAFDPAYSAFWTIGILGVLTVVLYKFAWPTILSALDEREAKIRESLEAAERASAEAKTVFEEHQRLIKEAREEAQKIVSDGREAGESMKNKLIEDAKAETQSMVERAKKEISLAEQKAVAEVRDAAVNLSLAAAGRIIGKVLDSADHKRIAESAVSEVEQMRNN